MVADVVDVHLLALAVLDAAGDDADAGFALGQRAECARVGQQGFQELDRHDLLAVELYLVDAGHPDVLQHPGV